MAERPGGYRDLLAEVDFSLTRASPFSYVCNACCRCCHDKAIRVGPYEVVRLARALGLTTTELLARHTEAGGTVLRTREDAACVFLGPRGCSVHAARPLACRVYPLARWVTAEGVESFGRMTPHPETAGVYGRAGTVQDFLDAQGLAPYFDAADRYGALYDRMVGLLYARDAEEAERRAQRRADVDWLDAGEIASPWLDVDATVAAYCGARDRSVPVEVDALVDLHVEALTAWLDALAAAGPGP
jgi:Fe-S-cluster containining protein